MGQEIEKESRINYYFWGQSFTITHQLKVLTIYYVLHAIKKHACLQLIALPYILQNADFVLYMTFENHH